MRHGRAKAARKTLKYFERTVNLKNKPYYCVLLDATFLIAMIRISSNNADGGNEGVSKSESTIVSRIERVLQVNGGGGSSFSGHTRDERLHGVVGGYNNNDSGIDNSQQRTSSNSSQNNNQGSGHRFIRHNVRYYIPQEAVDEIETILQTFKDRSEQTKKQKKQRKYLEKSKVFEDALAWIRKNSSKKHAHKNTGRCEVLPRLEALVELPKKKKKQETDSTKSDDSDNNNEDNKKEETTIGASDAMRRHIARDDGREDPEINQKTTKKQQQQETFTRTYIVASQEEDLLDDLRMLGTVPIMRCTNNASVLILENPSKKGLRTDRGKEQSKWKGALSNPAERALVDAAWQAQKKVKITGGADLEANKRNQSTRAKGPNPLSCKRKRTDGSQQQKSEESKSKKRRARAQRSKSSEIPATASAKE